MTVLDNVPVDRIGDGARKTDYRKVFLTILAGIFYITGWVPGRLWLGVRIVTTWAAHTWVGTAIRVGWSDGFKPPKR